jgi:DnaJ like chaperone protein
MGVTKWITGVLGWAYFGPLGGLIGFLLGSAIEQYIDASHQLPGGDAPKGGTRTYSATEQQNSFFVSLLVLSSAVMKADGKIHRQSWTACGHSSVATSGTMPRPRPCTCWSS